MFHSLYTLTHSRSVYVITSKSRIMEEKVVWLSGRMIRTSRQVMTSRKWRSVLKMSSTDHCCDSGFWDQSFWTTRDTASSSSASCPSPELPSITSTASSPASSFGFLPTILEEDEDLSISSDEEGVDKHVTIDLKEHDDNHEASSLMQTIDSNLFCSFFSDWLSDWLLRSNCHTHVKTATFLRTQSFDV